MRSDEFGEYFEDVSLESVALTWINLARRVGLKYVWGQYILSVHLFWKRMGSLSRYRCYADASIYLVQSCEPQTTAIDNHILLD